MAKLIILSDLHIWGEDDPLYESLLALIAKHSASDQVIVLAGDVFDLFIGNKPLFLTRYRKFIETVRKAGAQGAKIHYIEGNHDFLVKRAFAGVPGMEVHAHDVAIAFGGKNFFFAHGDTVDPHDYAYRFLRALFRSPLNRALVRVLPGQVVDWIGQKSSHTSRGRRPSLSSELPHAKLERLRKLYRNFAAERLREGYDYVVMGHCHDLDEMEFQLGDRRGQYINVGYPRAHGSYLSWTPGADKIEREGLISSSS